MDDNAITYEIQFIDGTIKHVTDCEMELNNVKQIIVHGDGYTYTIEYPTICDAIASW